MSGRFEDTPRSRRRLEGSAVAYESECEPEGSTERKNQLSAVRTAGTGVARSSDGPHSGPYGRMPLR